MAMDNRNALIWGGLIAAAALFTLAASSRTRKSAKDSAREAFGKADETNHDLPPFFAKLFADEKGDSPNPPSP